MAIDYSKLRSLRARTLIQALIKDGFELRKSDKSRRGVINFYVHPDGRTTTLHLHNLHQTFKVGTLKSIIERQAHWAQHDLKRLKLL